MSTKTDNGKQNQKKPPANMFIRDTICKTPSSKRLHQPPEASVSADSLKSKNRNRNPMSGEIVLPPLVFTELPINSIVTILKQVKVEKFYFTQRSIGTRLHLESVIDSEKLQKYLIKKKISFFTYRKPELRPVQVVLSGLHEVTCDALKKHLKSVLKIKCVDVKPLNANQAGRPKPLYLIYVENGTKLRDLRAHKTVMDKEVSWNFFRKKRMGVTQCHNCQMFGHGMVHCHLPTKCMICSGDHHFAKCKIRQNQEDLIKCANCGLNHCANDPRCDRRHKYILYKEIVSVKRKLRNMFDMDTYRLLHNLQLE